MPATRQSWSLAYTSGKAHQGCPSKDIHPPADSPPHAHQSSQYHAAVPNTSSRSQETDSRRRSQEPFQRPLAKRSVVLPRAAAWNSFHPVRPVRGSLKFSSCTTLAVQDQLSHNISHVARLARLRTCKAHALGIALAVFVRPRLCRTDQQTVLLVGRPL
jgi:hypothetical protein